MIASRLLRRLLLLAVMVGLPAGSRLAAAEQRTEVVEVARAVVATKAAPVQLPAVVRTKCALRWFAVAPSRVAALPPRVAVAGRLYLRNRRLLL
jgi:hypothetical protein